MHTQPTTRRSVTRTDVARHAEVSAAVVSYVVNDGPRNVAPETRARVLESIRVLGYRPNAAARSLKIGVTEIIGLVMPDTTNPFYAAYARDVEKAAASRGLSVIVVNSALDRDHEDDLVRKLLSRQVDGLLLAPIDNDPDLAETVTTNTPVVLLNRAGGSEGVASVGVDFYEASRTATGHLIGHGHRVIGLIGNDSGEWITVERERGWRDALTAMKIADGPVQRVESSRDGGYRAGQRLLALANRPTAIYVMSDIQAMGLMRALHEANVRVPEDMAVISFDGSIEAEFSWPPLTSMRQPVAEMTRAAVDALSRTWPDGPKHREFTAELVVRESCGCTVD